MKELLVKGDNSLNKELIKLLVDDEDYDLLSMFDWEAHLTPTNKKLKITSKRKYDRFKYETWFGEKLPIGTVGRHSLYLESVIEHMMYRDSSWFIKPGITFVNGNNKDYRKSNLNFTHKNKRDKRTYEEINKLRSIMMGVEPERVQPVASKLISIPWGTPNTPIPVSFIPSNGINQQFPTLTKCYVIIKTRGEKYVYRIIRDRNELSNYLRSELIKPEEMIKDNEFGSFFTTEGELTLYMITTNMTGRLANELDNVCKYVSNLGLEDKDKMEEFKAIIGYLSSSIY